MGKKCEHNWVHLNSCMVFCTFCGKRNAEHRWREIKTKGEFEIFGKKYFYPVSYTMYCDKCYDKKENWILPNRPITETTFVLMRHLIQSYGKNLEKICEIVNRSPEQIQMFLQIYK